MNDTNPNKPAVKEDPKPQRPPETQPEPIPADPTLSPLNTTK